jgi:hypothetical protein
MAKKKEVTETITIRKYDEEMGDSYDVEVKKEPVSNCELCSCAGCLDKRCCEHLAYWDTEHGQPARYQLDRLIQEIRNRDTVIAKLDKHIEYVSAACELAIDSLEKSHIGPHPAKAFISVVKSALDYDVARMSRLFAKEPYLCEACRCDKCMASLNVVYSNDSKRYGYEKVPECCGHKHVSADLPF